MSLQPRQSKSAAVKLWHDDVRRPPDDSWTWARTNAEARTVFSNCPVAEVSLDHDLGGHDIDPDAPDALYVKGASLDGSGLDLVRWMCQECCVPAKVTIHSWNPVGAERMRAALRDYGHECSVEPFQVPS